MTHGMDVFLRKVLDVHISKSCIFNLIPSGNLYQCCIVAIFSIACLVFSLAPGASATESSGLIIPLYSYPGTMWDEMIQEKASHGSVPIIAVINPANGPGTRDQNYVTGVHDLKKAGIVVLGYVDTKYGARNATDIESEMNSYKVWYGINGIFFDRMSNVAGNETFYSQLTSYAKSIGFTYTVGNPGADTLPSYVGTVDNIMIHDKQGLPPMSLFEGWHENFTKSNFSFVSYDVSDINSTYLDNATKFVKYLYVTDLNLPNPFLAPASYIDKLLHVIEGGGQSHGAVSIRVNTYSDDDRPLSGFWTTARSDKNSTSGFSPFLLKADSGQQYEISVANFGNYVFEHWDDGTTENPRKVTPTENLTLTAYYGINQTVKNSTGAMINHASQSVLPRTNSSAMSNQTKVTQPVQAQPRVSQGIGQMKNMGSIIVNIMYPTGDRADYTTTSFRVYQDTNQTVYRQIDSVPGNPFHIGNLPLNHRYKVEVFVNDMRADVEYANLEQPTVQMKMSLPLPVGMRLQVFYNDGSTPVSNATVDVKSQDNKTWATGTTDVNGESLRFWLEPTSQNSHYVVDVRVAGDISYQYLPVLLYPGYATLSGYDQEVKITAPWPSPANSAIAVKVYDSKSSLYARGGGLVVGVFDEGGNKVAETQVSPRGEADFTNIKVGDYVLRAQDPQSGLQWGSSSVTFDGKTTTFAIYKALPSNQTGITNQKVLPASG